MRGSGRKAARGMIYRMKIRKEARKMKKDTTRKDDKK
jgi:hypothetical protein